MADSIAGKVVFNVVKVSLFIISASLFCVAWFLNKDNLELDSWPTTKGKVFYSNVIKSKDIFLNREAQHYDLDIKYGYIVNKVRYTKKGLFIGNADKTLDKNFFVKQAKHFTKDAIVDVYYNPKNPNESYLVPEVASGTRTLYSATKDMLLFSLFLFLITPFFTLLGHIRFKKKHSIDYKGLDVPEGANRVNPLNRYR